MTLLQMSDRIDQRLSMRVLPGGFVQFGVCRGHNVSISQLPLACNKAIKDNMWMRAMTIPRTSLNVESHGGRCAVAPVQEKPEKRRTPAWTDRVLWRSSGRGQMQQLGYDAGQLSVSDHKPVWAAFSIPVRPSTFSSKLACGLLVVCST